MNIWSVSAAAAAKSLQSCPTLCDPIDGSLPGSLSLGFSRQEHWRGLPFSSPMHESESEVTHSCPTLSDPMDRTLPDSPAHGIFQARVLEWDAIILAIVQKYFCKYFLLCKIQICAEFLFICLFFLWWAGLGEVVILSANDKVLFFVCLLLRWSIMHRVLLVVGWCWVLYSSGFLGVSSY